MRTKPQKINKNTIQTRIYLHVKKTKKLNIYIYIYFFFFSFFKHPTVMEAIRGYKPKIKTTVKRKKLGSKNKIWNPSKNIQENENSES